MERNYKGELEKMEISNPIPRKVTGTRLAPRILLSTPSALRGEDLDGGNFRHSKKKLPTEEHN